MNSDLEAIIAADEESRARVAAALKASQQRDDNARAVAEAERQQRLSAAEAEIAAELLAIRHEGDAAVEELRRAQQTQLRMLESIGEAQFENAVRAYIDIVCAPEVSR